MKPRGRRFAALKVSSQLMANDQEMFFAKPRLAHALAFDLRITPRSKTTHLMGRQIIQDETANRQFEGITHGLYYTLPGADAFISDGMIEGWFDGLESDATEAGYTMPSPSVIEEAKRIVGSLRHYLPSDVDVCVFDEGRVAIEVFGPVGHGFLLVCEPGGNALCLVTTKNSSRRARYGNSAVLPDGFLIEGLNAVRAGSTSRSEILGFDDLL